MAAMLRAAAQAVSWASLFQTSATPTLLLLETAPARLTRWNKGDEPVHCEKCFNGACTALEVT